MTLPRTISQKTFAALLGVHENTASNLRRAGVLVLSPDRRTLLLAESLRAYVDYVGNGREANITLAAAQKQLIKLQADKLRMANAQRAGELILASTAQHFQESLVLQFRAAVGGMPGRHAGAFADPRAYMLLQAAAAEILAQVATWLERSQAPMFEEMAIGARERVRFEGEYDEGVDEDEDRSNGTGIDRAADEECIRANRRETKPQTSSENLPRTRRRTSTRPAGGKR